jgi:hypothetical protein
MRQSVGNLVSQTVIGTMSSKKVKEVVVKSNGVDGAQFAETMGGDARNISRD